MQTRSQRIAVCASLLLLASGITFAQDTDILVTGEVRDLNGNPVRQAQVILTQPAQTDGADATTVFTNDAGRFAFPKRVKETLYSRITVEARALGYQMVFPQRGPATLPSAARRAVDVVLVMQPQRNHIDTAPASAWLQAIPHAEPDKALVVRECVACHQIAHSDMRNFVHLLDNSEVSRTHEGRKIGWQELLRYMYGTSHEYFSNAMGGQYSYQLGGKEAQYLEPVAEVLAKYLPERLDHIEYTYGAPLAVTPHTQIREYFIANLPGRKFNAVGTREALLAGKPRKLWVVDVSSDHIYKIDPETGAQKALPIPFQGETGPHSIYTGHDGKVWLTYLFQQLYGTIDPQTDAMQLVQRKAASGQYYVSHDFATDWQGKVNYDRRGRLWFGDVASNSLGSIAPQDTVAQMHSPKEKLLVEQGATSGEVRLDDLYMYGTVLTSDRKYVWYTQLNGRFGAFNTDTLEFETVVDVPPAAGPRRLAITEKDILYVPLFGAGQIVEYDARARKQLGVYDLPDRAAAPYAVAWDAGRQVLWIATSNADAIYRFDPQDHSFGVIPLPRQRSYLRMLHVDAETGLLATSTGLLPARSAGSRRALLIDPGDEYSRRRRQSESLAPVPVAMEAQPQRPTKKITTSELEALSKANQCDSCHSATELRIGPPFSAVALRYAHQPRRVTTEVLAAKILIGGAGNWGALPMIPRERLLSADEARALASAILDLQATAH